MARSIFKTLVKALTLSAVNANYGATPDAPSVAKATSLPIPPHFLPLTANWAPAIDSNHLVFAADPTKSPKSIFDERDKSARNEATVACSDLNKESSYENAIKQMNIIALAPHLDIPKIAPDYSTLYSTLLEGGKLFGSVTFFVTLCSVINKYLDRYSEKALCEASCRGNSKQVMTILKNGHFGHEAKHKAISLATPEALIQFSKFMSEDEIKISKRFVENEISKDRDLSKLLRGFVRFSYLEDDRNLSETLSRFEQLESLYLQTNFIPYVVKALSKQKNALGQTADLLTLIVGYLQPLKITTISEIQEALTQRVNPVRLSQKALQKSVNTSPAEERLRKSARI